MSIESHAEIEGLRRVGRVVALMLEATRRYGKPCLRTRDGSLVAPAEHAVAVMRSGSPLVLPSPA